MVGDHHGGDLVQAHAAEVFRDLDGGESEFRGLGQQAAHDAGLFGFNGVGERQDLVAGKLGGGGGDLALFVIQILGGEDLRRVGGLKQETADLGRGDGRRGDGGH